MRVKDLLEAIAAAWEEFQATLDRVPVEERDKPGIAGKWSLKDVVDHIAWYEEETIHLIDHKSLVDSSSWWELPPEERNARIYEHHRSRPADLVLRKAVEVHESLVKALRKLDNDDLKDPRRFHGMPADWLPWRVIAQNTYEHLLQHIPGIRKAT